MAPGNSPSQLGMWSMSQAILKHRMSHAYSLLREQVAATVLLCCSSVCQTNQLKGSKACSSRSLSAQCSMLSAGAVQVCTKNLWPSNDTCSAYHSHLSDQHFCHMMHADRLSTVSHLQKCRQACGKVIRKCTSAACKSLQPRVSHSAE